MKTISVQIGNTDNKLSQKEWAKFVIDTREIILAYCHQVHFFGGSSTWESWQNVAWVFDCAEEYIPDLKKALVFARKSYNQDSVGYLEGETVFL